MKKLIILLVLLFGITFAYAEQDNHYAMVDKDGVVVNVIVWDGVSPYTPCKDCQLVKLWKETKKWTEPTTGEKKEVTARVSCEKGDKYKDGKIEKKNND